MLGWSNFIWLRRKTNYYISLSFEEQIKAVREKIKESLEEPQSLNAISSAYNLLLMFLTLKDETKIKQIAEMLNSKTKETVSGSMEV